MAGKKFNNPIIKFGTYLLILGVLPLITVIYLQKGVNYRLDRMEELQELGSIADFSFKTHDGILFEKAYLEDKISIVGFLNLNNAEQEKKMGELLGILHQQFGEEEKVRLVFFLTEAPQTETLTAFIEKHKLDENQPCLFLSGENDRIKKVASESNWPEAGGQDLDKIAHLALVDGTLEIRNFYDPDLNEDMKRLVSHVALLLPLK